MGSEIGATLEALAATLASRRQAGEESYTYRLLSGPEDKLLKKVVEEACEVALASKDVEQRGAEAVDHLRYEAGDLIYHLLVVLERYGISLDDVARELNARMTEDERPEGAQVIPPEHVKRS